MTTNTYSFENEINKIRVELYNEAKAMTTQQKIDKSNALAKKVAAEHGLVFVASAKGGSRS